MPNKSNHCPVSAIIPCYCASQTIERAVLSVINQSLRPFELFLIDDASPDDGKTLQTLNLLQQKYSSSNFAIHVLQLEKNGGPGNARNQGWDRAKGEYIAFLDADDAWYPQKILLQYHWMTNNPNITLSGHAYTYGSLYPSTVQEAAFAASPVKKFQLLCKNNLSTPSVMLKRNINYRFCSDKYRSEDYMLWLELGLSGEQLYYSKLALAHLFKSPWGEAGLSAAIWKGELAELDTYQRLRRKQLISLSLSIAVSALSLLKYLKRLVIIHAKPIQPQS